MAIHENLIICFLFYEVFLHYPHGVEGDQFCLDVAIPNSNSEPAGLPMFYYPVVMSSIQVIDVLLFCIYYTHSVVQAEPAYLESNSSWIGPVAKTLSIGNVLQLRLNVTIPLEKSCPGIVILTEPIDFDLIRHDCYDISYRNLNALYTLTSNYISLDWNLYDRDVECTLNYHTGTYNCMDTDIIKIESGGPSYAEIFLFYPCERKVGFNMTYEIHFDSFNESVECFELDHKHSPCKDYYSHAVLPNPLSMTRLQDVEGGVLGLAQIAQGCHSHFEEFVCRFLLPECAPNGLPCQSYCEDVLINACSDHLKTYIDKSLYSFPEYKADYYFIAKYVCKKYPTNNCFSMDVTCGTPEQIDNGRIIQRDKTIHMLSSTVSYECNDNYKLEGEPVVRCQYSGLWSQIPQCVLKESNTEELITGFTVGGIAAIIIIAIILILRFRQEIIVLLFVKFGFRCRRVKEVGERKYDAFIAYNQKDIAFVKDEILRPLESMNPPYNICIHHRDFEIGDWITNNIIKSVTASKRTIIVLSQEFINSQWCRFEFAQAHLRLIQDKSFKIIVIAMDDPKKITDIPKLMKTYIKTGAYIMRNDKLFWQKLLYQMPAGHEQGEDKHNSETEV